DRYEDARRDAEAALAVFDQLGVGSAKADAYRVLGMIYRETGRPALAESRLKSAIELAVGAGSVLNEAEAARELAVLYQTMGRNQEALGLLNAAHRLFGRLDAHAHLVHVAGKMAGLEATYLAVVREWGQSLESADTYTFGHCERVAQLGVAVARALGMDGHAQTTVRLGAYLHDLGKVRVPHEILSKPGPLTRQEFEVVQMHPIWGIELLAKVEFPWDLKPVIRWHHERYDGTGYPDRLCGDGGAGEQVIVHRHHHRDEHHAVVEQVQLEPREPQLHDARGNRGPEQRPAGDDLALEQRVLDVMPELDHERREPPRARPAHEAGQQHPNPDQHDQGIPIVQHLGVHEPGERLAQDAARLVERPPEHVHLIRLHQMLGPVGDDDDHERPKRPPVPRAIELSEEGVGPVGLGLRGCVSGVRHAVRRPFALLEVGSRSRGGHIMRRLGKGRQGLRAATFRRSRGYV